MFLAVTLRYPLQSFPDHVSQCIANERECRYRPSKRGGARRGERYQNAKQRSHAVSSQTPEFSYGSTHDSSMFLFLCLLNRVMLTLCVDSLGDNIVDLIYPLHEIRNVDNFVDTGMPSDMNPNADQGIASGPPGLLMLRAYRSDADLYVPAVDFSLGDVTHLLFPD
jgi:hypothetical protein